MHKDQAPVYRFPVSDMRDEAQRSEELAAAEDVRDAEVRTKQLEYGVHTGGCEVRVATTDPCAGFPYTYLQSRIIRIVVGVGAGSNILAGQVAEGGCVEGVFRVCKSRCMQGERSHWATWSGCRDSQE